MKAFYSLAEEIFGPWLASRTAKTCQQVLQKISQSVMAVYEWTVAIEGVGRRPQHRKSHQSEFVSASRKVKMSEQFYNFNFWSPWKLRVYISSGIASGVHSTEKNPKKGETPVILMRFDL